MRRRPELHLIDRTGHRQGDATMLTYTIGVIGIWAGLAALVLNIAGMRATPASLDSRKRRFLALCVFGLAVCSVTFVIGVQGFTVEGPILVYGWPFPAATTDRFAAPMGTDGKSFARRDVDHIVLKLTSSRRRACSTLSRGAQKGERNFPESCSPSFSSIEANNP